MDYRLFGVLKDLIGMAEEKKDGKVTNPPTGEGLDVDKLTTYLFENALPAKYQAVGRLLAGMLLDSDWDKTVDTAANVLKQYGKKPDGNGYVKTRDLLENSTRG